MANFALLGLRDLLADEELLVSSWGISIALMAVIMGRCHSGFRSQVPTISRGHEAALAGGERGLYCLIPCLLPSTDHEEVGSRLAVNIKSLMFSNSTQQAEREVTP